MKPTKYRIVIIILSFILGILNYLDRTAIAFFTQPIMNTFHLNHTGFGAIASAFGIGYLLFTFIGGWLADFIGSRRLFGITNIVWGICTGAIGFLTSFWGLFAARTCLGAAEGPVYPGLVRAFNDWMPKSERTMALAYAIPVSVAVAVILGGPLASLIFSITHTWQTMFFVLGGLSFVMAIAWYAIFRDDPAASGKVNEAELQLIRGSHNKPSSNTAIQTVKTINFLRLIRNPTMLSTYIAFFALGYFFWFVLTWLPDLLQESYNIDLSSSALFSVLPWIAYGIGSIGGGYVADRSARMTGSATMKKHLIWISLLGAAVALVPVFVLHFFTIAIIFISLALGLAGICVPPLWALNSDVVPQRPGLSSGLMDAAFALAGLLAPVVSGFLVQTSGSFSSTLVLTSVISAAAALIVIVMSNPDKASRQFLALSADASHVAKAKTAVD
jgi:MFS family permease